MSLLMPDLSLGDRVLRIADTQGSPTADELRRVCAAGSQDAVLRALGEAALADAASEARGQPPADAPELTATAWEALMRSAPPQARQASAELLALVPAPDGHPQLFKPVNGTTHGSAHPAAEGAVPVRLSGDQLVTVSKRWARTQLPGPAAHPAMPLAKVWAERQCLWVDSRESRILPAAFAAGFVPLRPSHDSALTLWPQGQQQGTSPNVAASPVLRLAVEIGCGIPYEARTDGTVLLPPLTVADLLAMLYPNPIRTAAWRRNRWERMASSLRGLERMCSAADPQRRPAFEILSTPGARPDLEDEVRLAIHAPTGDSGPRLPRDAMRSLGRGYGRGLWLMVSAARCWDRLIARKGELPSPVTRGAPAKSMRRLPAVGVDEIVAMCRWPGGPKPLTPAAVSRARSAAAATLETLADSGWLTLASAQGWHGAHSELVGPERSAVGVARSAPVRILPAPWWTKAGTEAPPAPQHTR